MTILLLELRTAWRQLRRAPGFALPAIAILALGIGANVAIFSIFRSIVLSPLPYPAPHRLVGFSARNAAKALVQPSLSAADFRDLRERATSFAGLAAFRPDFTSYVSPAGDSVQLVSGLVTEEFFSVFGIAPRLGRSFHPEEFSLGAPRTALISHACWQRVFGERRGVIGETVMLGEQPTTIIGIMPDEFREPEFVDVWLPFAVEAPENLARDSRFWTTIGRLNEHASLATAQSEVTAIAGTLAREYPAIDQGWTITLQPLLEQRIGSLRSSLLLLIGAVGLVLLVACVNLANLMLSRGLVRMPQLALRLALGATPHALARSVLWESLLLAVAGGLAGAALAAGGLPWLAHQLPPGLVPRSHAIAVDGTALGYALGLSALTGVVFGLLPAWQVLRSNVNELLKSAGTRGTSSHFTSRAQAALVAGQIALTLIVLTGAAVLARSLLALQRTDPGLDPRGVVAVRVAPGQSRWNNFDELGRYYERLLEELRRTPGVESVALDSSAPLCGISLRYPFWVQGRPREAGNADEAVFDSASAGLLATLKLPLRCGRFLEERDDLRAPRVCVINQALAQRLFPGQDPLGQRIQTVPWLTSDYREIVGVVGDTRQDNLADPPPPRIYVPYRQSPWFFATLLVRLKGGVAQTAVVQAALRRAEPGLTMTLRTLEDNIAQTSTQPRLRAWLFGLFGLGALGLSAFGIYASTAFTVSQRRREIGVRMALGASPRGILRWMLVRAGRLAAMGVIIGVAGALAFTHLLRSQLHGLAPDEPWMLASLAVFLPLVAIAASTLPALAAARVSPTQALQQT